LQFAQPLHVGLGGADGRRSGRGLVHKGVGVLAGDGVGLDQPRVALGLDAGVVGGGLRGGQIGLGLGQLLIHLGGGDHASSAPFFTLEPMSKYQRSQVAAGARVDGRIRLAVTLPGSTKLSTGAPGFGAATVTVGAASSRVVLASTLSA
jgi:hypothetical protein